jgi:hypothetical protein
MPWRQMGEWRYSSTILDLCTTWRWVINFTPPLLYHREKSPLYPLGKRLGEPQSRSECCGEEKDLVPLPGIESRASSLQPVLHIILRIIKSRSIRCFDMCFGWISWKITKWILVRKRLDECPFGSLRRVWRDTIKMDFKEMCCADYWWTKLGHDYIR